MTAAARKARVLFTVWIAHMSAYRAEIIIWMLSGSIPLIMMAVWIGKASSGAVGGFTAPRFAAYFLAVWLTQQLTVAWVAWDLDRLIRLGELSPKLLRPLDPLWEQVATHITEKVVRVPFMLVILVAGVLVVPGTRLTPDLLHAVAYGGCMVLGFAIRFQIAYCIGLLAFWTSQATAIDDLYFVVATFLTGGFAPLSLYPASVQAAIDWLPFPYIVYYPVQVLTGALNGTAIVHVLGMQLLWVLAFGVLRRVLWHEGLKRYGAVGA